jgi:hypothetical protein
LVFADLIHTLEEAFQIMARLPFRIPVIEDAVSVDPVAVPIVEGADILVHLLIDVGIHCPDRAPGEVLLAVADLVVVLPIEVDLTGVDGPFAIADDPVAMAVCLPVKRLSVFPDEGPDTGLIGAESFLEKRLAHMDFLPSGDSPLSEDCCSNDNPIPAYNLSLKIKGSLFFSLS